MTKSLDLDGLALKLVTVDRGSSPFVNLVSSPQDPEEAAMLRVIAREMLKLDDVDIRFGTFDRNLLLSLRSSIRATHRQLRGVDGEDFGHLDLVDAYDKLKEISAAALTEDGNELLTVMQQSIGENDRVVSADVSSLYAGDLKTVGNIFSIVSALSYAPIGLVHTLNASLSSFDPANPDNLNVDTAVMQVSFLDDVNEDIPPASISYTNSGYAHILAELVDCFLVGVDMPQLFSESGNELEIFTPELAQFTPENVAE